MKEQLSVLIIYFGKGSWKPLNMLTEDKKIIMPWRLMKQTLWTAEFNSSLPDWHCTSTGVIFLLLYKRQNFKVCLEIKLLKISARVKRPVHFWIAHETLKRWKCNQLIQFTLDYLINFFINIKQFLILISQKREKFFSALIFYVNLLLDFILFKTSPLCSGLPIT